MGYIKPDGSYYGGDRESPLDIQVPNRPTPDHTWDGSQWVAPDPTALADAKAVQKVDAIDRLQFEIAFDMENRMRVREGKATITRVQYRNALIAVYKAMP